VVTSTVALNEGYARAFAGVALITARSHAPEEADKVVLDLDPV